MIRRLFQRKIASAFPVFAVSVLSSIIAGHAYAQVAGGALSGTVLPQTHILVKNRLDLPKFEVDPFWPKPLPDEWVIGGVGGVCVDAQDHVFVMTSRAGGLTETEQKIATEAPPIIEFDPNGKV